MSAGKPDRRGCRYFLQFVKRQGEREVGDAREKDSLAGGGS
jgi:hypothetical protein